MISLDHICHSYVTCSALTVFCTFRIEEATRKKISVRPDRRVFGACHRTTFVVGADCADPMAAALQCQKLCCMCKECGTFFSMRHPGSKHFKGKCGGIPERAGRVECSKCGLSIAEKVWRQHSNMICKRRLQHLQKVSRAHIYTRCGRHETDGQNIHSRCESGWRACFRPVLLPLAS